MTRPQPLDDQLSLFFECPTAAHFQVTVDCLETLPPVDGEHEAPWNWERLRVEEAPEQLLEQIDGFMPRWSLSLRAHRLAGWALQQLNDGDESELERFMYGACLEAIMSTGDGSLQRPFCIGYPSDGREVCAHLGEAIFHQQVVAGDRGACDEFTTARGPIYFDLTQLVVGRVALPSRQLGPAVR